ncbi:putative gustatory receptor 28b [Ctenocephalides felis]|uniref:putative gustatory receptor 28b n=1 Tax=Ctenocephalides felis TaxID=7515 RepID=UPI000E6E4D63|nr:putative gustatory receptor 28b [Ctenocephalides felis]
MTFEPTDFHKSILPVFIISFASGLSPFQITGTAGYQEFHVTQLGIFLTTIQLFLYGVCLIKVVIESWSMVSFFYESEISKFGDNFQLLVGFISMILMFAASLLRRQELTEGFRILNKIDLELIKIAIWWAYVIPNLMLSFVVLQFVMSMYVITDRLICYNKLLKELEEFDNIPWINAHPNKLYTVAPNGNVSLCQRYKKRYVILDSIGKIHDAICDAADYLDRFFSIQMLVTCAVSFLLIIFGIYYTLISFSSDDSDVWHYFGVIMFFSSQTSSYLFQIVACVNMCTLLNDEAKSSDVLILKLLNNSGEQEIKMRLSQISMQMMNRKPCFTAWQLFTIERSLLSSIAGAGSTYLIILFQFSFPVKCIVEPPRNST